jgi:prepilin-type N-terminal cleavage/methylation domain-containing protein
MIPAPHASRARRAPRESAFTLVEMLVVLVIAAILIGIGILSLRSSQDRGNTIQATTTAHAVGEGIEQFQRDHGGRLPTNPGTTDWNGGWLSPADEGNQQRPYVKKAALGPLTEGIVSLETSTGATGPNPARTARIRYLVDANLGLYALVVRTDRGDGMLARCSVSNADPQTSQGAGFLAQTGAARPC